MALGMGLSLLSSTVPERVREVTRGDLWLPSDGDVPPKGISTCALQETATSSTTPSPRILIVVINRLLFARELLLREVQGRVLPFVVVDVDRHLRPRLTLGHLDISLDDVVLRSDGQALGKLAAVIGDELPLRFLFGRSSNGNRNARHRMTVRPPDGAVDQGVVLLCSSGILGEAGKRTDKKAGENAGCPQHGAPGQASIPPPPLPRTPRFPPRPRPPRASIPAARLRPLRSRCR